MFEGEDNPDGLDDGELLDLKWRRKARNQLLLKLVEAHGEARKGKRKTRDEHVFEVNFFENILRLRDDLWNKTYRPSPGEAHIVRKPVVREIFAAPYRDRIVHHLIAAAIEPYIDKRLWYYSSSCRKGRGTDFGRWGLDHHIRQVSRNYSIRGVKVVTFDIKGYFMHIKRGELYRVVMRWLNEIMPIKTRGWFYWVLRHAIYETIMNDPTDGVKRRGGKKDWKKLPKNKSLFHQPPGQGIVIGNYTSQLFSNLYLDALDRFITQKLGYKAYGRYVDDFYIVVRKEQFEQLWKRDRVAIANFLTGMGLTLHPKKTRVYEVGQEIPFLGVKVGVNHTVPGDRMVSSFKEAIRLRMMDLCGDETITSYAGMMSHTNHYNAMKKIFEEVGWEYTGD